jgi:hypothetical protein
MLNCSKEKERYGEFVKSNNLKWDKISSYFFDGAFIGDGIQGAMIFADDANSSNIRMLMGRYDVVEHSKIEEVEYCMPRLYIGSIMIEPEKSAQKSSMELNLWDGETSGEIITEDETISWLATVERDNGVFIVKLKSSKKNSATKVYLRPEWGISPSLYLQNKNPEDYLNQLPAKPETKESNGINITCQKHRAPGAHIVAWKVIETSENEKVFIGSIGVDYTEDASKCIEIATDNAIKNLTVVETIGIEKTLTKNRNWWHNYNLESFLEIPEDKYWQKFWWIQIYKFGCASSAKSDLAIDNEGPWPWKCDWGGIWWNLNIQLSYFPTFSANKLENGRSYINCIDRIYDSGAFHANSPTGVGTTVGRASTYSGHSDQDWAMEVGNLTWVLHSYWKYWKYSDDEKIGRKLFPMLADNVDFLESHLIEKDDGKLHMKPSRSPEYPHPPEKPFHWDTTYALMSLKWALKTLLSMEKELGISDKRETKWKTILDKLVEYPTDENGLRISAEQGYDVSHRHFTHLIAFYPYHEMTPENSPEEKELFIKTLERWLSLTEALEGYSFTGGCTMYGILGEAEKAIVSLDKFKAKIEPNTMYQEGGGPVIETPLSTVEAINYLLLQSWGGVIRTFPAAPSRWQNISFCDFRTEGGFLVSGIREKGKNISVTIKNTSSNEKTLMLRPNLDCDIENLLFSEGISYKLMDDSKTFELAIPANSKCTIKVK